MSDFSVEYNQSGNIDTLIKATECDLHDLKTKGYQMKEIIKKIDTDISKVTIGI